MKNIKVNGIVNTFKRFPKEKQILYLAVASLIAWLVINILNKLSGLFIVVSIGLFIYYLYLRNNKDGKNKKK